MTRRLFMEFDEFFFFFIRFYQELNWKKSSEKLRSKIVSGEWNPVWRGKAKAGLKYVRRHGSMCDVSVVRTAGHPDPLFAVVNLYLEATSLSRRGKRGYRIRCIFVK